MGEVELDEVVAEQEASAVGEIVEFGDRLIKVASLLGEDHGSPAVGPLAGERVDALRLRGNLKIN